MMQSVHGRLHRTWYGLLTAIHVLAGLVQPDFVEIAQRHGPDIVKLARQLWRD